MLFFIIFVPRQTCELIVDPKAKVRKLPVKQFNWTKETKIIPDINDRRGFEMMFLILNSIIYRTCNVWDFQISNLSHTVKKLMSFQ